MTLPLPPGVEALLTAQEPRARASAWESFLSEYSQLLLQVARSLRGTHDEVMDRYTYVVEQLARDDYRKLRGYNRVARASFRTWLAFVARNLCLDHCRQRYGRRQKDDLPARDRQVIRRQLADLVTVALEDVQVASASEAPDAAVQNQQTRHALVVALAALEPHDRLLLRLRFEDELSVPQIARTTGYPNPFVLYRKFDQILSRLRAELVASGIESSVAS